MTLATVERYLQRMVELRGTAHHQIWAWLAASAGEEYVYTTPSTGE